MKRDEEIAKDLVKEHLEAIKEMPPSQVEKTEEFASLSSGSAGGMYLRLL